MTTAPATSSARGRSWWTLVALLAVAAGVSRLCYLIRPFDSDGAMFIYQGRVISEGGRFGHEIVDNKFPTVGLLNSAFWRAFGANWYAYVLLGAAMSIATLLTIGRAVRRHLGADRARSAMLFALVYLNFNFTVFGGFQLETTQMLFTTLAALAAFEALGSEDWRDAFTVGLCAATGAFLKPTGLSVACAFAVAVLMFASSWRSVLKLWVSLTLGMLIPIATALAYLIGTDNLRDMPALARQISSYAASSSWAWADIGKPIVVLVLGGFPFLVRAVIFRRAHDCIAETCKRPVVIFLILWLILEAIGVAAQKRMYAYHFMVLAPPLAMLFGCLPRRARPLPLAAALCPIAAFSLVGACGVFYYTDVSRQRLAMSDYIAARTESGDSIWKDDATRLLLETGLHPGSRFVLTFLFANSDSAPVEYASTILQDFDRTHPRYIVLHSDMRHYIDWHGENQLELSRFPQRFENFRLAWEQIDRYVRDHYELEACIEKDSVWRRRDTNISEARIE